MSLRVLFRNLCAGLVGPSSEVGIIEHNERGGFGIREMDSEFSLGNYPSFQAAADVSKANGLNPQFHPRMSSPGPVPTEPVPAGALKYVIFEESGGAEHMFFCLPPSNHDELTRNRPALRKVIGAGFITFLPDGSVRTYGDSHSLKIGPSPTDAIRISAMYRAALRLNPIPEPK